VIESVGAPRVQLFGISCGVPPAISVAANRPALVERLVVFGGYLHGAAIGRPDVQQALVALVRASWGLGSKALCDIFLPGASPEVAQKFVEDQRESSTGEMSARLLELTYRFDVRQAAARVRAPALVLHRRDDRAIGFDHGREVAAGIAGAELVALDGAEHLPWLGDSAAVLAALGITAHDTTNAEAELRRDGEVWTVRYAGLTVHAKHALGLRDLASLLAHPGRRFQAIELMAGADSDAIPISGFDPVLDDAARKQFRTRLAAIEASLHEREPDAEHVARLEEEREAIVHALKAATGLGGRRRTLGDDAERARKAVSARIRDSIARLAALHPELGKHLGASIETGATCVYAPAEPLRWRT
jgi:hypothetical protein